MLALIGNLSLGEVLLIAVVAVLVFGRRLPQVAGQAFGQMRKARRALDDLRRESGIDDELRSFDREVRDVTHEARIEDALRAPDRRPTSRRRVPTRETPPENEPAAEDPAEAVEPHPDGPPTKP